MRISDWSSDVCSSDLSAEYSLLKSRNILLHECAALQDLIRQGRQRRAQIRGPGAINIADTSRIQADLLARPRRGLDHDQRSLVELAAIDCALDQRPVAFQKNRGFALDHRCLGQLTITAVLPDRIAFRSADRRVGKECASSCKYPWS